MVNDFTQYRHNHMLQLEYSAQKAASLLGNQFLCRKIGYVDSFNMLSTYIISFRKA